MKTIIRLCGDQQGHFILGKQCGAALITALLVIAIVATIAVALMSRLQIDIERSALNFNADAAYLASQQVRDWGVAKYTDIYKTQLQHLQNPNWPITMDTIAIPNGTIIGTLQNAQGAFNINNLTNPAYQPFFARLIQYVQPNIDYDQALTLAKNVTFWLSFASTGNTFDAVYQQKSPPYRAAHRLMISASELRLVDGFTGDLYQALSPYIIALPQVGTTIDVNAASEAVLIAGGISQAGAEAVINYLKNSPAFNDMDAFNQIAQFDASNGGSNSQIFGVTNSFAYAQANITLGNVYFVAYYLLQYQISLQNVTVIQYSQGTL